MKTLLIDLGNTALKWTICGSGLEPATLVHRGSPATLSTLYDTWLSEKPDRVLGCTVAAPELAFEATRFFNAHGISWHWVHSTPSFTSEDLVLRNSYQNPMQLGADRWCAAIGAIDSAPADGILVVQMGTATTADAIIREGEKSYAFLGGRIAPGPTMMQRSLVEGIAALPPEIGEWHSAPQSTKDAIVTGILDAQTGLVRLAMEALEKRLPPGSRVRVVIAGGSAKFVSARMREVIPNVELRHNMVLLGLSALARMQSFACR